MNQHQADGIVHNFSASNMPGPASVTVDGVADSRGLLICVDGFRPATDGFHPARFFAIIPWRLIDAARKARDSALAPSPAAQMADATKRVNDDIAKADAKSTGLPATDVHRVLDNYDLSNAVRQLTRFVEALKANQNADAYRISALESPADMPALANLLTRVEKLEEAMRAVATVVAASSPDSASETRIAELERKISNATRILSPEYRHYDAIETQRKCALHVLVGR